MKKKLVSVLLMTTLTASMVVGCGSSSSSTNSSNSEKTETSGGSDITIGSVIMNTSGEWFAEVMVGQQDAANELGIKLELVSADNDISTEYDKVDAFVSQGVDALVICPISYDSSVAAVEVAKDADIPVVNWNCTVNTETTSFIGVDATSLGGNTGDYLAEYVNENFPDGCKVAILGDSSYEIGIARVDGFKAAIQGLVDEGKIEIVNEQDAEAQDEGYNVTEQMLTADSDIDVIWAWNQTSLLGAAAFLATNQNSDIVIMGTDMSVELAKYMQGDQITMQAITTQQPYELGYKAVMNAYNAIQGEEVESTVMIPVYTYVRDSADEVQEYIDSHELLIQ